MVVTGLTLDPKNQSPVVMLRDRRSARELHIHIGVIEASAIAFELEQVRLARPMAHDLLRNTVAALGGEVASVVIVGLREHRYAALLVLHQGGRVIELDAKPSDGIALALRSRAPIYCDSRLLERAARSGKARDARVSPPTGVPVRAGVRRVGNPRSGIAPRKRRVRGDSNDVAAESPCTIKLEHLRPEDFGKYKQ
jgi:bifunctional DNase/RNase